MLKNNNYYCLSTIDITIKNNNNNNFHFIETIFINKYS